MSLDVVVSDSVVDNESMIFRLLLFPIRVGSAMASVEGMTFSRYSDIRSTLRK